MVGMKRNTPWDSFLCLAALYIFDVGRVQTICGGYEELERLGIELIHAG